MSSLENLYNENKKLKKEIQYLVNKQLRTNDDTFILAPILLIILLICLTFVFGTNSVKCLPIECSVIVDGDKFKAKYYNLTYLTEYETKYEIYKYVTEENIIYYNLFCEEIST